MDEFLPSHLLHFQVKVLKLGPQSMLISHTQQRPIDDPFDTTKTRSFSLLTSTPLTRTSCRTPLGPSPSMSLFCGLRETGINAD